MELPKLPDATIFRTNDSGYHAFDEPEYYTAEQMQEYARQAVLMEREECARLCDAHTALYSQFHQVMPIGTKTCATAIRART